MQARKKRAFTTRWKLKAFTRFSCVKHAAMARKRFSVGGGAARGYILRVIIYAI